MTATTGMPLSTQVALMPSTWSGLPLPMILSSSSSRISGRSGRSSARKYKPFDVPPRISMQRMPVIAPP
jgi:hypothetical protein